MSADKALLGRKGKIPKSHPDQTQTAHNKTVLRSNIHLEKQNNNNNKAEDPNSVQLAEERSEEKKHNTTQFKRGKEKWNCKTISPHQRGSELQSDSDACAGWVRENASWVNE
jgi:hypothetical protein